MSGIIKILMLEDSSNDAELIQRTLQRMNKRIEFHVVASKNAFEEALERFQADIVLADNSVPGFKALDVVEKVRTHNKHLPIIVVTGTMSEEYAVDVIKKGADDYILKDRMNRLHTAIESALNIRNMEWQKDLANSLLTASESRYRKFVERISDGFLTVDTNLTVEFVNKIAEQMLQVESGTLIGKNLADAFPKAVNKDAHKALLNAVQKNKIQHVDAYSEVMKKWLNINIYPSATGLSVFFRDITDERAAKEELRKAEEKYKEFIQRITDAFIALDSNWCYTYLNKKAADLIQKDPEKILGKNVWDVFPEAVGSKTYYAFKEAMQRQQYVFNEDYFEPLDLWQENHIYPSEDGLSVFIRDISERKKLERALKEKEEAEQIKLLAAVHNAREKERNAIGAELHDNVNQILVGTNMLLSIALDNPGKSAEIISNSIMNLKNAIKENRRIAHELVTPDFDHAPLQNMIERLIKDMLTPQNIISDFDMEWKLEEQITGEQKLTIYRILQEQFTNILKYSGANEVQIKLHKGNGIFHLDISDNGKGSDPAFLEKGIGLKNMLSRLKVHNGSLQVDTNINKGFSIQASFPLN